MPSKLLIVVQLALGLVFFLSAVSKVLNPKRFAQGVVEYRLLPKAVAYPFAAFLIGLEGWLAVAHLTGWLLEPAVPIGIATLSAFGGAVVINLRRGRIVPCYCFGGRGGERISPRTLARVLALILGEVILLVEPNFFARSHFVYGHRVESFSQLALAFFWATFILIVAYWVFLAPEIVTLFMLRKEQPSS
jgi:Methylamine utilisation protein MauE